MNFIKNAIFAATVAIAGVSSVAHAGLINDTIDLTGKLTKDSNAVTTQSVTIGGGLEFSNIAGYLVFDFSNSAASANTLTVTVNNPPNNYTFPSNLGTFVFSKFDDTINNVVLSSDTPKFNNFTASDFTFDSHSLTLDFSGVNPQNGQAKLVFNITSGVSPAAAVPEPTTVALLGLGLLGVVASRRKRGNAQA